jgi:hypothetical protein
MSGTSLAFPNILTAYQKVFLIDVLKLGEDAFITTSLADNSLKLLISSLKGYTPQLSSHPAALKNNICLLVQDISRLPRMRCAAHAACDVHVVDSLVRNC